jgi:hypothetical protein
MRKLFYTPTSFLVIVLFFPLLATAQHASVSVAMPMHVMAPAAAVRAPVHAGPVQPVHPAAHTASAGAHPGTAKSSGHPIPTKAHAHPVHSNGGVVTGPTAPRAAFADDGYETPGLGFDYTHFAAVHPEERHRHPFAGGVFPFVGGGIFLPTTGYVESGAPQDAADEPQQGEATERANDYVEATPVEQSPNTRARMKSSLAPASSTEYIFVRRDGTVFFAVAYSWVNGSLQYVTQDGLRKLVSSSTLDLDATAQFNEQRGVAFHAPA